MAGKHIYTDRGQLILEVGKDNAETVVLEYRDIESIEIRHETEKKFLFWPVETEQIAIRTKMRMNPYIFSRRKDPENFKSYILLLEEYASKHHVPFENHLPEGVQATNT